MQSNDNMMHRLIGWLASLLGIIALTLVGVIPVKAAVLVVDFNSNTTGQLAGQAGGAGLSGTWGGSVNNAVVAGDLPKLPLSYPQTGTPQKLDVALGAFADLYTTISLATPIPTATEYWMSFLLQVATPGSDRLFLAINPTGIGAFDAPVFFNSNGTTLAPNNGADAVSLVNGENFIVIRRTQSIVYGPGNSKLDIWVNPVSTNVFAGAADGGRVYFGYNGGIASIGIGGYSTSSTFDNLRIGTSLLDVVMIPEPSTILLFGVGGWLLVRFRRRR